MPRFCQQVEGILEKKVVPWVHHLFWMFAVCSFFVLLEVVGFRTPLRFFILGLDDACYNLDTAIFAFVLMVGSILCGIRLTFGYWWDKLFHRR